MTLSSFMLQKPWPLEQTTTMLAKSVVMILKLPTLPSRWRTAGSGNPHLRIQVFFHPLAQLQVILGNARYTESRRLIE